MAHRIEQKVSSTARLNRIAEVREALGHPTALRVEAERLLAAAPADCHDVLTWSPEGYGIALVASVLADDMGRDLTVHQASLVAPLAPRLHETSWAWVCAEELLGVSEVRGWASEWADARGGTAYSPSGLVLVVAQ